MNTSSYYEYFTEFFIKNFEENPGQFWENYVPTQRKRSGGASSDDQRVQGEPFKTFRLYFRVNKNDARPMKTNKTAKQPELETPTVRRAKMLKVLQKCMEYLSNPGYRSKTLEGLNYDNHIFANEAMFLRELLGVLEIFRSYTVDTYSRRTMTPEKENQFVRNTVRCVKKSLQEFIRFAREFKDDLLLTARQHEQAKCNIREKLQNVKVNRETILLTFVADLKEHVIESE